MNGLALYLHIAVSLAGLCVRYQFCMYLHYFSILIPHHTVIDIFRALDDIRVFETHLLARAKPEKLLWRIFHKVVTLYPQFTAELNLMGAISFVLWIVDGIIHFCLSFREIGDDEFDRVNHSTHTLRSLVKVISDSRLEERHLVESVKLSVSNLINESENALRTIAPASETAYSRHARVVPTVHYAFFNKHEKISLREKDVCKVELIELNLTRAVVVKWLVVASGLFSPVDKKVI